MLVAKDGMLIPQGGPAPEPEPVPLPAGPRDLPAHQHPYHKYCACGRLIWDCPRRYQQPKYTETLVCPDCGAVYYRRPLVLYQIWWVRQAWRRRRRAMRRSWRQVWAFIRQG